MIKVIVMITLAILGAAAAMLSLLSAMDGNVLETVALIIGCVGALGTLKFVELTWPMD